MSGPVYLSIARLLSELKNILIKQLLKQLFGYKSCSLIFFLSSFYLNCSTQVHYVFYKGLRILKNYIGKLGTEFIIILELIEFI